MKHKPHKNKQVIQKPQEPVYATSPELLAAVMRGEVPADKLQDYANKLEYADSIAFQHGMVGLAIIYSRLKKAQVA